MAEQEDMRTLKTDEIELTFKSVKLIKKEILGSGSYGFVCKAKCDQLTCAAKLLYPALLQREVPDPGKEHRQPYRRFESECSFIKSINHPNIIQYLGTCHDQETNFPVLLMELMDESLTHFLESSPSDIPYHIQVNLSYDIAQALAFLHTNGIIHRDLSSNNVLLVAGCLAKVTDFGMSRIMSGARTNTMTKCPGTPAYMPPEALDEPLLYTEALDNFSFGVLTVQIMTRKFPDPTDRFVVTDTKNPQYRTQVCEIERREAHISLVDTAHPLLPVALDCLKNQGTNRPTSQRLCQILNTCKESQIYLDSLQQDKSQIIAAKNRQLQEKDEQIRVKNKELQNKKGYVSLIEQDMVTKIQQLCIKEEQLHTQKDIIDEKVTQIEKLTHQLREEVELSQVQRDQLDDKNLQIERLTSELDKLSKDNEQKLREMNDQLRNNEQTIDQLQQQIAQQERQIANDCEVATKKIQDLEPDSLDIQPESELQADNKPTIDKQATVNIEGSTSIPTPEIWFGTPATIGNKIYFNYFLRIIEYDSVDKTWSETNTHPLLCGFSIVNVDNILTTVGGEGLFLYSKKLFCYLYKKWVEILPQMKARRNRPAVVYAQPNLVVIGGDNVHKSYEICFGGEVEILNTETLQWSSTNPFSYRKDFTQVSATLLNDQIYVLGTTQSVNESCLCKCSVRTLTESKTAIWHHCCSLPLEHSFLTSTKEQLLAIGGYPMGRSNFSSVNDISKYIPSEDRWKVIGRLSVPRSNCSVAVLPDGTLMVASHTIGRVVKYSAEFISIT